MKTGLGKQPMSALSLGPCPGLDTDVAGASIFYFTFQVVLIYMAAEEMGRGERGSGKGEGRGDWLRAIHPGCHSGEPW